MPYEPFELYFALTAILGSVWVLWLGGANFLERHFGYGVYYTTKLIAWLGLMSNSLFLILGYLKPESARIWEWFFF